jgi:AIPR protein
MLERNNGITVRAESVERLDNGRTLMIHRGAIVNGCQTTMCLWELQTASSDLQVVVKVVQVADTETAWRIAQSANYQNPVGRMELELARFLRPQLVTRAAAKLGEGLKTDRKEGLAAVLRSYTQTEVSYALIRHLFVGLFCRRPNQLFQDNYTNVQMDVVNRYYSLPGAEDHLFTTLFTAIKQGREALAVAVKKFENEDFAKPFSRLLDADQHKYQAYLLLLALCTSQRVELSERTDIEVRSQLIFDFLTRCTVSLEEEPHQFSRAFLFSYKELARITARSEEDTDKTIQRLSSRVRDASFHELYSNICMELKSYEAIKELDQT